MHKIKQKIVIKAVIINKWTSDISNIHNIFRFNIYLTEADHQLGPFKN